MIMGFPGQSGNLKREFPWQNQQHTEGFGDQRGYLRGRLRFAYLKSEENRQGMRRDEAGEQKCFYDKGYRSHVKEFQTYRENTGRKDQE